MCRSILRRYPSHVEWASSSFLPGGHRVVRQAPKVSERLSSLAEAEREKRTDSDERPTHRAEDQDFDGAEGTDPSACPVRHLTDDPLGR